MFQFSRHDQRNVTLFLRFNLHSGLTPVEFGIRAINYILIVSSMDAPTRSSQPQNENSDAAMQNEQLRIEKVLSGLQRGHTKTEEQNSGTDYSGMHLPSRSPPVGCLSRSSSRRDAPCVARDGKMSITRVEWGSVMLSDVHICVLRLCAARAANVRSVVCRPLPNELGRCGHFRRISGTRRRHCDRRSQARRWLNERSWQPTVLHIRSLRVCVLFARCKLQCANVVQQLSGVRAARTVQLQSGNVNWNSSMWGYSCRSKWCSFLLLALLLLRLMLDDLSSNLRGSSPAISLRLWWHAVEADARVDSLSWSASRSSRRVEHSVIQLHTLAKGCI
jgi:hypothetical protein